jgi:hypothetical protein
LSEPARQEVASHTNASTILSQDIHQQGHASPTDGANTFNIFPKLPIEMQNKIWRASMVPRIMEFRPGGAKSPKAMHACREARRELRKHYELRISVLHLHDYDAVPDFGIFVNWDLDIINIERLSEDCHMASRRNPT